MIIGDTASLSKKIRSEDIDACAELTNDYNPIHFEVACKSRTLFPNRIAHGILSTGLISAVLGTKLPGDGAIYLEQFTKFVAPVTVGDEVTATVTVEDIIDKGNKLIIKCSTQCHTGDGTLVIDGYAKVLTLK